MNNQAGPVPPWPMRLRVWLIDDDETMCFVFPKLLAMEGVDCSRQFLSAEAAFQALSLETAPEVILLDLNLAGQSGLDALRPLRQCAPQTAVVMWTTFTDTDSRVAALQAGAADFRLKSEALPSIVGALRRARQRASAPAVAEAQAPAPEPVVVPSQPWWQRWVTRWRQALDYRLPLPASAPLPSGQPEQHGC